MSLGKRLINVSVASVFFFCLRLVVSLLARVVYSSE